MKRFIPREHRSQSTLLPESLDDYVSDTKPVRVVDVFVGERDLITLGLENAEPAETGRTGYHPAVMLKIYIYGYLNPIHSSRRFERETLRNVVLMWLTARLMPDFNTIANFRKNNIKAIRGVSSVRRTVPATGAFQRPSGCYRWQQIQGGQPPDGNFSSAKLKRRMEEVEASIARYMAALDAAGRDESKASGPTGGGLQEKIGMLKEQLNELQAIEVTLEASPDKQVSLTDPDTRSMMSGGKGIMGYNVQTAVDTKHHLIVAHDVTNEGQSVSAQLYGRRGPRGPRGYVA